jgi:MFS family permease
MTHSDKARSMANLYPWIVWSLAASFFFYKYLLQMSPSVMSGDLMRAYSINGAGLGNLAACFFYAYALMQIPVGILLDKWSPRIITAIALFVCVAGTFWFAHASSLWMAEVSRFIIGLGASFAAVSCFKLTSIWFTPRRFALVAGLSMTAAMLGALGGVAPLSWLVQKLDWRSALNVIAMLGLILLLLMILIVRDKKVEANVDPQLDHTPLSEKFKIIFKDRQTWLLSFYSGLAFAPVSVFGGLWGVSFIQQAHHLSPVRAATVVSMIFVGFAIGCPIAGWFSDFVQRRISIMFAGTFIAFCTLSAVLYIPVLSAFQLQALLFLLGLGASCFFLCFAMIREIHSLLFVATVLGFMNTFDSICEAVTEPFIGWLLDMGWAGQMQNGAPLFSVHDYRLSLTTLPIYFAIAMILLFFTKETFCKQK